MCTLAADYEEVVHIVEHYLESRSPDVREKVMGRNAAEFYGLAA